MNDFFRIPIGSWVAAAFDWIKSSFDGALDLISLVVKTLVQGVADGLLAVPAPALIILLALLGWIIRSWQFGAGTLVTLTLIIGMSQWENAMFTLALVVIATLIAVIIGVPLGILAAKSDGFSAVIRPILDFMQTMPSLVYLIPAVTFFAVGFVPGVFATVLFALPPGVRFTELGIRGVDAETVEAGHAFGSTPGKILRGIQLPLAMPTILAGINQVIMLALSMAVIAGMAGANGLGKEVVSALATLNIAKGVEAGLAVVILAVFLDRLTAALGTPGEYTRSLRSSLTRRRSLKHSATRTAQREAAPAAARVAAH